MLELSVTVDFDGYDATKRLNFVFEEHGIRLSADTCDEFKVSVNLVERFGESDGFVVSSGERDS